MLFLQHVTRDAKLIEHRFQQSWTDFLAPVFQRRETTSEIKTPVAAFAAARVERHRDATLAADLFDPALKFVTIHTDMIAQICAIRKPARNKPARETYVSRAGVQ
jgi:hypothetical protein